MLIPVGLTWLLGSISCAAWPLQHIDDAYGVMLGRNDVQARTIAFLELKPYLQNPQITVEPILWKRAKQASDSKARGKRTRPPITPSASDGPPAGKAAKPAAPTTPDSYLVSGVYTAPVDLHQRAGEELKVQGETSYNWYSRLINLPKAWQEEEFRMAAMAQARHLVQQKDFIGAGSLHPNDMTAIYVPISAGKRTPVMVAFATNLRFDTRCRPAGTKAKDIVNSGPNHSKANDNLLPLAGDRAQDQANKQGPHGEWVCIDDFVAHLKLDPESPRFPDGTWALNFNLKNPKLITEQAACDGIQHDCAPKLKNMNIIDLWKRGQESEPSSQLPTASNFESGPVNVAEGRKRKGKAKALQRRFQSELLSTEIW